MALLAAIPLLALILLRMLWSASGLWFLTVGLILLGAAAVVFLARRPQEVEYGRKLAPETNRLPLALAGMGVLFLALLLLPNFAGGSGDSPGTTTFDRTGQQTNTTTTTTTTTTAGTISDVADTTQPSTSVQQPAPAAQEPAAPAEDTIPDGSTTYTVAEGDTLWDIAISYSTTVEAIIAANDLENPADIQVGQELIIPPPSEDAVSSDATEGGAADDTVSDETAE
jgi:LysM repeat protein